VIPYLCPTLPKPQKEALRYGERAPMVSSTVLLREGRIFERTGAGAFYSPGRLHGLAFALGRCVGRYQEGWDPAQPVVLYMMGSTVPMAAPIRGATEREQFREGRRRLYAMSFTDFEREIREHLAGMLGATGFEPARDILAITVNRWPHGYAYSPNPLFDPEWPEGQAPNEIARRRFGRIAIANTDAAYFADVGAGADEAHRAVRELGEAGLI
jgi:spermidine dehydrogenase